VVSQTEGRQRRRWRRKYERKREREREVMHGIQKHERERKGRDRLWIALIGS